MLIYNIDMDEQGFATLSEWGFLFLMKTRKALAIKTKGFFAIVSNFRLMKTTPFLIMC